MSPRHHPSEAVLADYVSGAQRPAFAATTTVHLEGCSACREQVRLLEEVAGDLMVGLADAALEADSTDRALARLDQMEAPATASPGGSLAARIQFGRRRWIAPGVWLRHAQREACGRDLLYLLHVPPGMAIFSHSHAASEHVTVLKGGFTDESGSYGKGDFSEMLAGVEHRPVADQEGDCICLVASERPMEMRTWLGRLFQTFARV